MAEPTDRQSPAEPDATPEPVVVEPVSAAEHVGVEPDVPVIEEDEVVVVDDVADPVVVEEPAVVEEPVVVEDVVVEEVAVEEPVTVEPVTAEPVTTAEPVAAPVAAPAAGAAREVVYVQAPTPPKRRHNRGFGALISLLGTIVFALLYLGAAAVIFSLTPRTVVDATFAGFLQSDVFWVPIIAYGVFSVLFALIVNRAAWWAHVIGSLFVALLTYGASLGVLALLRNVVAFTPGEAVLLFSAIAASPLLLAVAILARETSLWFGLAIAARGRRVKERNAAELAAFERDVAERRAEYERAHPSA